MGKHPCFCGGLDRYEQAPFNTISMGSATWVERICKEIKDSRPIGYPVLTAHNMPMLNFEPTIMGVMNMKKEVTMKSMHFNPPYTTVVWMDGSKTVVKCSEHDDFDPEKGIALCYMKKVFGNDSTVFHKRLKEVQKRWYDSIEVRKRKQAAKEKKKTQKAWEVVECAGDRALTAFDPRF